MKNIWILLVLIPALTQGQFDVSLQSFANGFDNPCEIVNAGDQRLFVVEQGGKIKILHPDGTQEVTPFLNITSKVNSGGEKGLLGLAFEPNYCTTGRFYVNYTFMDGGQLKTRISRFRVNPENENEALPDSEESLLEFNQPYSNHNGGHIEFGPDGYLYIGTGDGGSGGDPQNNSQNTESMLGKLLRLDVSTDNYSIPADNPFANSEGNDEIWAYGLRNPWKFAFDSETGDLFIGDVGQNAIEEVNFQTVDANGGANFGWRCYEGTATYNMSLCADLEDVTFPVFEYNHNPGSHCSITGGRVYRGNSFESLQGKYIASDLCSGDYWLVWLENGEWQSYDGGLLAGGVVAFGEDVWGELYAAKLADGSIWRVTEASGSLQDHISMTSSNTLKSNLAGVDYTWYLNGTLIEGANDQLLEISENGMYSVIITDSTGCAIEANPLDIINVGVRDHSTVQSFKVFPNPASELLHIELDLQTGSSSDVRIQIFDVTGKEVLNYRPDKHTFSSPIDVSRLHAGIYFLYCIDTKGEILATRKLVIN